ncbi:hypothetical protein Pmani_016677 [Petrolisthes manimaculis]|uniref:E3 ubiquitin-protein ligase RNF144B n=1 Tax=Petrolisthes manimaculis TaxID=1843537 RepID=A0AAE1UA94_9EUCA|nr:hypothetical protein Pmani_016677 [Petrolisthes manimaculis]
MSTIPLLLPCPPSPAPPSPRHHPLTRPRRQNNRNSFPPDQTQESRWAAFLARAVPPRPYGACAPAPLHPLQSHQPQPASQQFPLKPNKIEPQPVSQPTLSQPQQPSSQPVLVYARQVTPVAPQQPQPTSPQPLVSSVQPSSTPQTLLGSQGRPVSDAVSFSRSVTSPTAIKLFNPSRRLNKSQSQLIMPRMKSLFRSGGGNRGRERRELPRDTSLRSLGQYGETTSPEPLLRKCHTVLALSSSGAPQTKLAREKKGSKLDFLRRMSPSKSAVFASKLGLPRSPSARDSSFVEGEGGGCSRCASTASITSKGGQDTVFCKLCLSDVSIKEMYQLQQCLCRFCKYCMSVYVALKIREGDYNIQCPDANCDCQGELGMDELQILAGPELYQLHLKFKINLEVDCDPMRVWCPMPGCETIVQLGHSKHEGLQSATCQACTAVFCAKCSLPWHPATPCLPHPAETLAVPYDDTIKRCPSCKVPIERDAGCAQMLCKRCKHVFCWYCLTSLDDDFLLRHYDKGPCKNKLGHSRASVLWHRAQVIGIFAGFGLLLVMASPLLLFVGPCLLCCKCKPCSKNDLEDDSLYGL